MAYWSFLPVCKVVVVGQNSASNCQTFHIRDRYTPKHKNLMKQQFMKSKIGNYIIPFLVIVTIFSCEKNKDLESNNEILSVNFSDGLDVNERIIVHKAQELIMNACVITNGKYNLSNISPTELGVSQELFQYIKVNSGYLNSKIDLGIYRLQDKILVENNSLKNSRIMQKMALVAEENIVSGGGGGSLVVEIFETPTDWYKVYNENGFTLYEYTNTTYSYRTETNWIDNTYVYSYGPNSLVYYAGEGGGGGYPIPSPKPNNNLTREGIQKKLCEIYNGIIVLSELEHNKDIFSPAQEQFIIGLANIAALNGLNLPLNNLKNDLRIFPTNSELYSKYNILDNHTRYTSNWSRVYNSSPNSDYALLSPIIAGTNFQLKFYPEKNGENNALGLVKEGIIDHSLEAAIELIEVLGKNAGLPDDFLYDMHLWNALNFMEDYCNE